jgi:hypothetical protein
MSEMNDGSTENSTGTSTESPETTQTVTAKETKMETIPTENRQAETTVHPIGPETFKFNETQEEKVTQFQ